MHGGLASRKLANMQGIHARFKFNWPTFKLDVDLQLPARGVIALFGHSGSGKTTLLRCIAGLEKAPQGHLMVNDEVWQDEQHWLPTHQRGIGYVFQEASLFSHLTVMGNLQYGRRRVVDTQKVNLEQVIDLLGIEHLLKRKPDRLSGGEQSRVSIARALAANPSILLMDEPLAALDLKRKQEIIPYLERLHESLNIPIIYVSHAVDEVARLADYLVVMEHGRVLANGTLADTLTRLDLPIHLGLDAGVVLDATVVEIDKSWHLARVAFDGGCLWTHDQTFSIGKKLRVQVLARDVSLASEMPSQSSIQNVLQGRIDAIADDHHPSLALVRVQVGNVMLLSRLTKRAVASLNIVAGQSVWVQVKSVALIE
jgi:molybdate transport system ATP-binding protein